MKNETREIVKILEENKIYQYTNKYFIYHEGYEDESVFYDASLPVDVVNKINLISKNKLTWD